MACGSSSRFTSRDGAFIQESTPNSKPNPKVRTTPKTSSKSYDNAIQKQQQTSTNVSSHKCFKCQGYGHIASKCPNCKIVKLVEEEYDEKEIEKDSIVDPEEEDEDVTFGDQGESLIAQRHLSVAHGEEVDDWLRKNIFHIKCTSHGKVCDVIVDGGNFEDVVSTQMVEKLHLKTKTSLQAFMASEGK